ncbi:MAG: pyridine nucleotide-disulfide oxidoreductase, partial [Candidatus Kerfeldbacteria bacterium]|nr:pyridine nucleotide-disulfide oxidoreductase [Candidatus Kerfeldbacteria bacterium]
MTYDLIIIGGSAAGSAAAVYAARRKLNLLMISEDFGGEVANSGEVWNYPGIVQTTGFELAEQFKKHIQANGVEPVLHTRVQRIVKGDDGVFTLHAMRSGEAVEYQAKS